MLLRKMGSRKTITYIAFSRVTLTDWVTTNAEVINIWLGKVDENRIRNSGGKDSVALLFFLFLSLLSLPGSVEAAWATLFIFLTEP